MSWSNCARSDVKPWCGRRGPSTPGAPRALCGPPVGPSSSARTPTSSGQPRPVGSGTRLLRDPLAASPRWGKGVFLFMYLLTLYRGDFQTRRSRDARVTSPPPARHLGLPASPALPATHRIPLKQIPVVASSVNTPACVSNIRPLSLSFKNTPNALTHLKTLDK